MLHPMANMAVRANSVKHLGCRIADSRSLTMMAAVGCGLAQAHNNMAWPLCGAPGSRPVAEHRGTED
jgi:hypothetical protein